MGGEVVDGETIQGLEGKGPDGDLEVRVYVSEVKIGSLDGENEGKGRVVSSQAMINGGEGGVEGGKGLEGAVMAENGKGMGLEPEESFRSVGSSFSLEKDRGKDEALSQSPEGEVVSSLDGDGLMSLEGEMNVAAHDQHDLLTDGNEENVARVSEIAYGEKEGDRYVEQGQVEQHSVVKHESLGATSTGSVRQITDGLPSMEVEVANRELLHQKELNGSTQPEMETCDGVENHAVEVNVEAQTNENKTALDYASETWVSQDTETGLGMLNTVIDLEPYMETDGNVSSEGNGKSTSSEREFQVADLVWGKVRSHPWWPGQICCPSTASEKAKKYYRKGSYLIVYFWDNTFAWNDAPQIKPYLEHFSQMEKQSNMEEFQDAIACSLDEVSRRVELGLICSCISREVHATLNTQIISNAGIREEASRRDGGDSSLDAASFEPEKLIRFIKQLAKCPYSIADRLELVKSRAQLSAFNRSKGCSPLPEYNVLGGLLEDADILLFEQKLRGEVSGTAVQNEDLVKKSKGEGNSSRKRKNIYGDSKTPRKREKMLSDLGTEKYLSTPMSDNESEGKSGSKLTSRSSNKKRNAVDAMTDGSAVKQLRSRSTTGADNSSHQTKQTFRVGDRICRVASQLSGSSPILKNYTATSKEASVQDRGEAAVCQKPPTEMLAEPNEMLSQLHLAAFNPTKEDSGINSTVTCFSEFWDTVCINPPSPEESLKQMFGGKLSSKKSTRKISSDITETSDLDSEQKISGGDGVSDTVQPALRSSETQKEELSPTALILKFTDLDSVPSKANLNKIFGCYGTLIESETEVLKKSNRVRVVFKKRSDAETAFSSTGKYNTFGPSLVGYSLKFLAATPSKSSPSPSLPKPGNKDAATPEGNAT